MLPSSIIKRENIDFQNKRMIINKITVFTSIKNDQKTKGRKKVKTNQNKILNLM